MIVETCVEAGRGRRWRKLIRCLLLEASADVAAGDLARGLELAWTAHLLLRVSSFRLALPRPPQHKLPELLALDLSVDFACKLADVLREHGLLDELLAVVLLDVAELFLIRHLRVVDDRFHVVFQLLHDVLVLQRRNVHVFALDVGVEQGALLRRVAVFEAFVPPQALELQVEVQNE